MRKNLGLTLIYVLVLAVPSVSSAETGHEHKGHEEQGDGHHGETGARGGIAKTWTALAQTRDAIAADIDAGKLGEIHEKAEGIAPLAHLLAHQSTSLEPQKSARIKGAASQISKVADALHKAADAGDEVRTKRELKRLDGLIELLRAQYPEGVLGAHDHE